MYASYWYSAGATAADILADVVAILIGETTVGDLSTSCNDTNTTITASARVAGWTVHDASAGTNAQCLRAAIADDASKYKYLWISTNTSGYIITALYETWDETAHTGTNVASGSNTSTPAQLINLTYGGRLEISASARHACFFGKTDRGLWGNTSNYATCIFERTRLSPWDTVARGYLPAIFTSGVYGIGYECRRPSSVGAVDITGTTANVDLFASLGLSGANIELPNTNLQINAETTIYPMIPFGYSKQAHWHMGGWVSNYADMFLVSETTACIGDTFTLDGNEYTVWQVGTTSAASIAVRKG